MRYRIVIPTHISVRIARFSPTLKQAIREALDVIAADPLQGKPLRNELIGCFAYRVLRYRIVYRIVRERVEVQIITIGHRRTVYETIG